MSRSKRVAIASITAALVLVAGAAFRSPANASAGLDPIAVAQAQLANCQLLAAHPSSSAQRTRAQQCVTDQTAILRLLVPTPSPTGSASSPTPSPTGSTSAPSPSPTGSTSSPPTTVPPTTVPPTTTPPTQTTNCTARPSACGYPDATNTGAGQSLVAMSGDLNITTAGTVIDGRSITGCVSVSAPNVIIRNTRIVNTCGWAVNARGANLVLDHVTVSCSSTAGKGVVGVGFSAKAMDVSGCEDGFYIDPAGATVQDSYVHNLFHASGAHTDSVQVVAGGQAVIVHNTLWNQDPQGSSDVSADTTDVHDVLVMDNLMAGGGYSMRCPDPGHGTNVQVTANRFSMTDVQYAVWNGCGDEAQVSGNVRDETGAAIKP